MKIAILGSRGFPARYGGVERAVEQIALGLTRRGHNVIIYSRASNIRNDDKIPQNIRRIVIPTIGSKYLGTFIPHCIVCR